MTIGLFLLPNSTFACETKVEKPCCNKEITSKIVEKDCCKKTKSQSDNEGCNGKCGHSNCTTSAANSSIILHNEVIFKNINLDFSTKKRNFFYAKTFISSGFKAIWLIPKIS